VQSGQRLPLTSLSCFLCSLQVDLHLPFDFTALHAAQSTCSSLMAELLVFISSPMSFIFFSQESHTERSFTLRKKSFAGRQEASIRLVCTPSAEMKGLILSEWLMI
jgi:hypothetical protein